MAKKLSKQFLLSVAILLFSFLVPASVFASGASVLKVSQNNDVMYVTTEASSSASLATSSSSTDPRFGLITMPHGFFTSASQLINNTLKVILVVAALLVFAYLIWGGLQWITSGGEKAKTEAARNRIISAIIGLIVLAASYAILTLVLHFLGFSDLNEVLSTAGTIDTPVATSSSKLRNFNLVK